MPFILPWLLPSTYGVGISMYHAPREECPPIKRHPTSGFDTTTIKSASRLNSMRNTIASGIQLPDASPSAPSFSASCEKLRGKSSAESLSHESPPGLRSSLT